MKQLIIGTILVLNVTVGISQEAITLETFQPYTLHFSLEEGHEIGEEAKAFFLSAISENQFVGIAEVHQSPQLSFFTVGFLSLLKEKGFNHFALEIGPYSAEILQELSAEPEEVSINLRALNQAYGTKRFPKIPIVFVDKVEDAEFVKKAAELGYKFWGLDQEFSYSYEMHLDKIYGLAEKPSREMNQLFLECKSIIKETIFKSKISGVTKNCWLQEEPTLQRFFALFQGDEAAEHRIEALRISWDIYCKNETGQGSNQQRADYMKQNFERQYDLALQKESKPKVFVKLGGVHLTHGTSIFGVEDVGKYLTEKGKELNTGFLTIRHLSRYKNGRDLTGKKGWKSVELLMENGKKDQWTVVDLRPLRQKLQDGELTADEDTTFELYNYDLLLISPDDKNPILNY